MQQIPKSTSSMPNQIQQNTTNEIQTTKLAINKLQRQNKGKSKSQQINQPTQNNQIITQNTQINSHLKHQNQNHYANQVHQPKQTPVNKPPTNKQTTLKTHQKAKQIKEKSQLTQNQP